MIIINSLSALKNIIDSDDLSKQRLEVLLDKGQSSYNIHIIIIEENKKKDSFKYESWYKEKNNSSNAIWLGSSIDDYTIDLITKTPPIIPDYEEEYGYMIVSGRPYRIKLIDLEEEKDG